MSPETRKGAVAAVLLAVMAMLWYRAWQGQQSAGPQPVATVPDELRTGAPAGDQPPSVNLRALEREPPAPGVTRRNPFQFGGRDAVADAAPPPVAPPPAAAPSSAVPAEPALSLKLIGIVQPLDDKPRVAVLSDDRGVYHGVEGATIEGRYRIARIDAQSVELRTLDGSGVYVLRLPPT